MNALNFTWLRRVNFFWLFLALLGSAAMDVAAESGEAVVVIYNNNVPESKEVAEYYARRRNVPENQVVGFDLPRTETMSRSEFRNDFQRPLFRWLEKQKLFVVRLGALAGQTNIADAPMLWQVRESKIRYAALCYGVPSRIIEEPGLREPDIDKLPEPLRRNEAAVDSELALLPLNDFKLKLTGIIPNPFYGGTNAQSMSPTNGILMVSRLDGPSPEIARGLVDKAMAAETNGLWGRAYFDLRGLTNGEYSVGDAMFAQSAETTRRLGFETVIDKNPSTFPPAFPMSHIAIYGGWYDEQVSGPFTRREVEFMPGAVAYHLHSYNAAAVRSPSAHWVGPLLDKGATATFGYVAEPYLSMTVDMNVFVGRFMHQGCSLGEAVYMAEPMLSWQTTVIGDPLYRPFLKGHRTLHEDLNARKSNFIEWSHLRVVNVNLVGKNAVDETIAYLNEFGKDSPILTEKLGDVHDSQGKTWSAIHAYTQALDLQPSPQQEVRLLLTLAEKLQTAKQDTEALAMYRQLIKKFPDYPDKGSIYTKMAALATKLGKQADADTYNREAQSLRSK